MDEVTLELLHKDLEIVKRELREIKNHMVDIDSIMTEDDYKELHEYNIEKSEKKLTAHDELKQELGL